MPAPLALRSSQQPQGVWVWLPSFGRHPYCLYSSSISTYSWAGRLEKQEQMGEK